MASDGFSAGLRWQQNDDQRQHRSEAPLGFGAAHIEQSADDILRVTTSKGVTLDSDAASDELRATLGFEPRWAACGTGSSAPATRALSAQESLDAQQRLAHLEQEGWQVDYGEYVLVQQQWLPQRLTSRAASLRLRVVVTTGSCDRILVSELTLVAGAGQAEPVPARHRHAGRTAITSCRRCFS